MRTKTCTVLVTLAIMSLCLTFLATSTAYAQVPVGPNRPAGVPDGYVITPFGYFHPSCVRQLAKGETLLADGRVIQHANGTQENIAACEYPHYAASGAIVAAGAAKVEPPEIDGWVESASVTTNTSYGEIVATWTVPPAPNSKVNQIVYFFPGMQDSHDVVSIIQPVLGWNSFFGEVWSIASWNCCPSGTTNYSTPVRVNPGDTIQGTVESTCSAGTESCATWNITTEDVTLGASTTLSNSPSERQTFNWAFGGVLEAYGIDQCGDYPANGSLTFSNIALYDYNFVQIPDPDWSITDWAQGQTPQCNYGGQVAATQVTLDYGTATLTKTTTTLTSSPNPSTYEQAVVFTATVSSALGPPPDGESVSFMEGQTVLGTGTLSGGSASFTDSALKRGTNSITAVYAGDSNFAGSTSKAVKQVVSKATTATTLTSSLNPSQVRQSVTFTAVVTPQFSGTVTGKVTFYDGTTKKKIVTLSGGVAEFTTSKLTAGTHTITATYKGSADFDGSSASLTQTVN